MPTGDGRLLALNAVTGKPRTDFGDSGIGSVDLLRDIPRLNQSTMQLSDAHDQPDAPDFAGIVNQVGNSSPGIMCNGVLVLGSSVHDGEVLPPSPPGDVRGFDPITGQLLWTFIRCLAKANSALTLGSKAAGKLMAIPTCGHP